MLLQCTNALELCSRLLGGMLRCDLPVNLFLATALSPLLQTLQSQILRPKDATKMRFSVSLKVEAIESDPVQLALSQLQALVIFWLHF